MTNVSPSKSFSELFLHEAQRRYEQLCFVLVDRSIRRVGAELSAKDVPQSRPFHLMLLEFIQHGQEDNAVGVGPSDCFSHYLAVDLPSVRSGFSLPTDLQSTNLVCPLHDLVPKFLLEPTPTHGDLHDVHGCVLVGLDAVLLQTALSQVQKVVAVLLLWRLGALRFGDHVLGQVGIEVDALLEQPLPPFLKLILPVLLGKRLDAQDLGELPEVAGALVLGEVASPEELDEFEVVVDILNCLIADLHQIL